MLTQKNYIFFNPLEQFDLTAYHGFQASPELAKNFGTGYFTWDHMWSLFLIVWVFICMYIWNFGYSMWSLSAFISIRLYRFVLNTIKNNFNAPVRYSFFPALYFLFCAILGCNFVGMIPYSTTISSYLIVTFFFGTAFYIGTNIINITLNRMGLGSLFYPPGAPLQVFFMLPVIELVSYLARNFSISTRLMSNMIAGHVLLKIIASFFWLALDTKVLGWINAFPILSIGLSALLVLVSLETLIAFLQSYIFLTLFTLYINDVVVAH